jgi:hypothetical protein
MDGGEVIDRCFPLSTIILHTAECIPLMGLAERGLVREYGYGGEAHCVKRVWMIGLAVIIDLPGVGPLIQVRGEVY